MGRAHLGVEGAEEHACGFGLALQVREQLKAAHRKRARGAEHRLERQAGGPPSRRLVIDRPDVSSKLIKWGDREMEIKQEIVA